MPHSRGGIYTIVSQYDWEQKEQLMDEERIADEEERFENEEEDEENM